MSARVTRSDFETLDVDQGVAVVREAYPGSEWRAPRDAPFHVSLSSVGDDHFSLFDMDQRATVDAHFPRQPSYIIGSPTQPTLHVSSGRDALDVTRPFLYPLAELEAGWTEELNLRVLQVREEIVREGAAARYGCAPHALQMTGTAPISAALERYWNATVTHARLIAAEPELIDNDLIRHDLLQNLVGTILTVFPHNFSDESRPHDRGGAATASVRRAIAFMEQHVHEPMTIADIAEAARMSPRGIQNAFKRDLGTTPLAYVRRIRLDAAHRSLLAADPTDGITVAETARRWGFPHPGRFAMFHRETYGETPAQTLQR